MLINFGTSDHCFVNKKLFISFILLYQPTIELTASKESTFNVIGKRKAKIQMTIDGIKRNITFKNVLYTPNLRSNLISMSKLAEKGIKVEFNEHKAQVKTKNGTIIMTAKQHSHLYAVETLSETPTALVTQAK